MKLKLIIVLTSLLALAISLKAQHRTIVPDLSRIDDTVVWNLHNRRANFSNNEVRLDDRAGDGVLWIRDIIFSRGSIELDIKGKDEQGKSFVGLAFHGLNSITYDAIYFRPFNFLNPERKNHSVQYVSHPIYTWNRLREEKPGVFESTIEPVPDPNGWFHVKVEFEYPIVKVYVDKASKPSLIINQLSSRKRGWLGFWVGNNSEGSFRNLKITSR